MTVVVATVLVHGNESGLREVLRLLAAQERPPDAVVVVDNGSSPPIAVPTVAGTAPVRLVRLDENLGVGGGHNAGIGVARDAFGADVVWLLEHDTFPDANCLAQLLAERARHSPPRVIVPALTRNNYERHWITAEGDGRQVARFTLNGPLIDVELFDLVGLLNEDYFVGQEDWDLSQRAVAAGANVVESTSAVAVHAHKGSGRFGAYVSPARLYYSSRNLVAAAGRPSAIATVRAYVVTVAKCVYELLPPGRGRAYAAARWWALRDGRAGRLGRRDHRFMVDR